MSAKAEELQRVLAHFCRTDGAVALDGGREDPLPKTLRHAFPMTVEALGSERWDELTECFCSQHKVTTPHLWRYPRELCTFVSVGGYQKHWGLPFLGELMELEWIEIELFMMPDQPIPLYAEEGDLTYAPLILNPEHRLMRFTYPVFRVPVCELECKKGNFFLVVFRNPETLGVEFVELTPPCALAVERLAKEPVGNAELWDWVRQYFPDNEQDEVFEAGTAFTESMIAAGLILGFGEEG